MVSDISKENKDILLSETENIDQIVEQASKVITNQDLKNRLVRNGLMSVKNYSWERISQEYYKKIYSKLI